VTNFVGSRPASPGMRRARRSWRSLHDDFQDQIACAAAAVAADEEIAHSSTKGMKFVCMMLWLRAKCMNGHMFAEYLMTWEPKLVFEGMTCPWLLDETLASTGMDIESSNDVMTTGR